MSTSRQNVRRLDPFEQHMMSMPVTDPPPDGISLKALGIGLLLSLPFWAVFLWWVLA
jgi:hypothetical protein